MVVYLDELGNPNGDGVAAMVKENRRTMNLPAADHTDAEMLLLKTRIQLLESALWAALRLRGLGEVYHDNLALIGERRKYKSKMDDVEAQIREALNFE